MPVSIVTVELHIPEARSLKDKRRTVKSLRDKIHARYRVSIAETRYHDLRQRSEMVIATVAPDMEHLQDLVGSIRDLFEQRFDLILTRWDEQIVSTAP